MAEIVDWSDGKPHFKGELEHHKITRLKQRREVRAKLKDAKAESKARDLRYRGGCSWPRADHDTPNRVCLGGLESAHKVAIGMGGDKDGSRTRPEELLTVCRWIHQDSPDALERHGRAWEGLTEDQANGPVIFSRRVETPEGSAFVEIARERSMGILER